MSDQPFNREEIAITAAWLIAIVCLITVAVLRW